jgi:hypothetical protein
MSFLMCPVISPFLPLSLMRVPSLENQGMTTAMSESQPHKSKSIPSGARYVTLHIKIG